jgi:ABC-type bacteriocin/lantibiotic exporter with double-glycine peptidase domain
MPTLGVWAVDIKDDDRRALRHAASPPLRLELWQTAPSCGANSLYFMLRILGADLDIDDVRSRVTITGKGASLGELREVSRVLGHDLEVRRVTLNELLNVPLPAVALVGTHQLDEMGHFMVLYDISDEGHALAIDGTTGHRMLLSSDNMNQEFSGFVLIRPRAFELPPLRSLVFYGVVLICVMEAVLLLYVLMAPRSGLFDHASKQLPHAADGISV